MHICLFSDVQFAYIETRLTACTLTQFCTFCAMENTLIESTFLKSSSLARVVPKFVWLCYPCGIWIDGRVTLIIKANNIDTNRSGDV